MTKGADLKNLTKNTKTTSAEAKAVGLSNGNAKSNASSSCSSPIIGSKRLSDSPVPLNDDPTVNASVTVTKEDFKKATKASNTTKSTVTKSSQNTLSSSKKTLRVMSVIPDASKTSTTPPFKSRTLPLPTQNGLKANSSIPESFTSDLIFENKAKRISSSNTSSEVDGASPTARLASADVHGRFSPVLKSVNVKNTIATLEKKVTQNGSFSATSSEISPTTTNFTVTSDTNLEDMDMEQLEQLFLNGTRSPSIVSNYSSNAPWKSDIPLELSDVSWKSDDNTYDNTRVTSVATNYHFTDPDEQLRTGLSMIQEAYNRKSLSVSSNLCDGDKGK
ncbi:25295_t:CDS:2, partial [Racocetra persica]